jgi:hypothetical protein
MSRQIVWMSASVLLAACAVLSAGGHSRASDEGRPADRAAIVEARPVDRRAMAHAPQVVPWRTITLGMFKRQRALLNALDDAHIHIGESAEEALHAAAFMVSQDSSTVQLVVLKAEDLGFDSDMVRLGDIYVKARQLGFALCRPEIAVYLRLAYRDQPLGDFLRVAMEPLMTYRGDAIDLTLANTGTGLLLLGGSGSGDTQLAASTQLVFVRPAEIAQRGDE